MGWPGCGGQANRPDALTGSIVGKGSENPVAAATVHITAVDGNTTIAQTITDASGRFLIVGMRDGVYKAWASKDGYFEESRTFSFPEERRMEFTMQMLNEATGTVKLPDGAVGVDVVITFQNLTSGEVQTTRSLEDGSYRLRDLKPGDYRVRASTEKGDMEWARTVTISGGTTQLEVLLDDAIKSTEGVEHTGEVSPQHGADPPKLN